MHVKLLNGAREELQALFGASTLGASGQPHLSRFARAVRGARASVVPGLDSFKFVTVRRSCK